jgi:hypothetical protein
LALAFGGAKSHFIQPQIVAENLFCYLAEGEVTEQLPLFPFLTLKEHFPAF